MNLQEMLNDLDDAFLLCARDAVCQLFSIAERKSLTDDDVVKAIAASVAERQLALTAKLEKTPLVYCSTPELCISTEEFACRVGLTPQQIRHEYLATGSFREVLPMPLYDCSLAWPLYRIDAHFGTGNRAGG